MNKADTQSEVYSSELNCMCAVREGTKVVVGSGEGVLYLFNQVRYFFYNLNYLKDCRTGQPFSLFFGFFLLKHP